MKTNSNKEPKHIKIYPEGFTQLSKLSKHHERVLFALIKGSTSGMTITLTPKIKEDIAKSLDIINISSINNALCELVKCGILFRVETGAYQLNPKLFVLYL